MLQAVIFDVDGVLVDSFRPHFLSWRQLASEHGFSLTEEQFTETFGRTSRDIIRRFWAGEAPDDRRIRELDDRKEALYRRIVSDDFPAMDGAVSLLDSLHTAGVRIAVGSSGPPENVDLAIEKLGRHELIGAAVTGMDVTRGKPDPQVFAIAAERLGISPSNCIVVEDAPDGIRAAKAAGMGAVALVSTGRTEEDFAGVQPDLVVGSLRELTVETLRGL